MGLYYVETDYGCGIREAKNVQHAWKMLKDEVIERHAVGVRRATEEDIESVRQMGGDIPNSN